jgi:hypothetical protein
MAFASVQAGPSGVRSEAERASGLGPTEDRVINWNETNDYQADRETGT